MLRSVNPHTAETLAEYPEWDQTRALDVADACHAAYAEWRETRLDERARLLVAAADLLEAEAGEHAARITAEMGKPIAQSRYEIGRCALVCRHYAEHGAAYLADRPLVTPQPRAYLAWRPLGVILSVMPWNFPYWQLFRIAAPTLMAGNTMVLKHASNVQGCALAMEDVFARAGFPKDVFRTLVIGADGVGAVIGHPAVKGVSLTGSEGAGAAVAARAGAALKPCVLELGGSDAFVVLADADLAQAAEVGAMSRTINAGQSCIGAKRFIVHDAVYDNFLERFRSHMAAVKLGDPTRETTGMGPLARAEFVDQLARQVDQSVAAGATVAWRGETPSGPGAFYPPTILESIRPGSPAWGEEFFGPVALFFRARDEAHALELANATEYGLGGSVWTANTAHGEAFAARMETGNVSVNTLMRSHPTAPFGGIGRSGFGRELGESGIRAFCNQQTVRVG